MAKKERYYENTIFIIVADHNTRIFGDYLVPIHKFHIPAVILRTNITPSIYDKLCNQIDIAPTLLNMMSMDIEISMPGWDLFHLPEAIPRRAIMYFYIVDAFRSGDDVVILQSKGETI